MQYYDDQEKELIESFEKSKWTSLKGKKKISVQRRIKFVTIVV